MTEITRTNPLTEAMTLRDAMDRLFADSFVNPRLMGRPETMPLDMYETEHEYVAKLAVPGLKPDDFEITMQDSVLRVHGETRVEEQTGQEEQARYHVREQRFGTFDRVVRFPSAVDNEQVSASLSEGILTVRVPKSEAAKPKRITVTPS
jgi:HSP20 family protein